MIIAAKNLAELFTRRAQKDPAKIAYRRRREGQWFACTWQEFEQQVFEAAAALLALGLKKGDRVALLSQTRPEWTIMDFAILSIGGVTVPIYQSVTADEVHHILHDSGARMIVVEDSQQRKKVFPLLEKLKDLKITVSFEGIGDNDFESWKDFLQRGLGGITLGQWRELCETHASDDLATIVYTSGTTGQPKGAELKHLAFLTMIKDSQAVLNIGEDDATLLFLPTAHILGRIEQMLMVGVGWNTAYAEGMARLIDDMQESRPTLLISVPRIYEKFYATLVAKFTTSPQKKWLFEQALATGRAYSQSLQRGLKPGLLLRLRYEAFDRTIFTKIREKFGGRLRFAISGGAPLSVEIAEFFHACGILILEGYGLTETTGPVVLNREGEFRFGTVGKIYPNIEVQIAADGEILMRGDSIFKNYHGNPELTHEVLDADGFFHTGDIGDFDGQGYLKITDRKKDLIVTAGGKNIAPQKIENLMKAEPLFSNAVVFGDREKYLVMLLCLNPQEVRRYFQKLNLPYSSYEEALRVPAFASFVKNRVEELNNHLASFERVKRFKVLPRDLSLEAGELTPSLKVKRKFCAQKYSDVIQEMYKG